MQTCLAYSQDFSNIYQRVKIWPVSLRPRRKPHWVPFSFASIILRDLFFKSLGMHLSMRLRREMPRTLLTHSPVSLCLGMITAVCQIFGAFPEYQATWHTWVSQKPHDSRLWAFQIGFHHSLQPSQPSMFWQLGKNLGSSDGIFLPQRYILCVRATSFRRSLMINKTIAYIKQW